MKSIFLCILALISARLVLGCKSISKPTPESIIAKYITAIGGEEKLRQIRSVHIKATVSNPQGKFNIELIIQVPDQFYIRSEMADYKNILVINGQNGAEWVNDQKKELSKEMIQALHDDCYIFSYLYYQQWEYKLASIEDKKIDGKDTYGVKVTNQHNQDFYLYFDKVNGLLLQRQLPYEQDMIFRIKNFKKVDGVLYPNVTETIFTTGEKFITDNFYIKFNEESDQRIFKLNE